MTTAFVSHPIFQRHLVPGSHPENPQRLSSISEQLRSDGLFDALEHFEAPVASEEQINRVHYVAYLETLLAQQPEEGIAQVDADTFLSPDTLLAAMHAAGAVVLATDLVLDERVDNAFCCVRPPGHHASRETAMGFCFINNIAVGAAHALARDGIERVAILDFDVHHGNGTEDIIRGDERILFCSSYQHPLFPYSSGPDVDGHIINVPLPSGTDGALLQQTLIERWQPEIQRFQPDMIFLSAGFDAHKADPLAEFLLSSDDFGTLTRWAAQLAVDFSHGRLVSSLEGGYNHASLGRSVAAHLRALLDAERGV